MTTNEDHTAAAIPAPDVTEAAEAAEAVEPSEVAADTTPLAEPTEFAEPTEAPSSPEAPQTAKAPDAPHTDPLPEPTSATDRPGAQLRPRTGTIVWGVLVLAFCAFTSFQTVAPNQVDGTTFVIAAMIGIGLLLLAVGTAVVVRSARQRRR